MAQYITTVARQISNTASSATYECTVTGASVAFYGHCFYNNCLVIMKAGSNGLGKPYKYWGFPKARDWDPSWGEPRWELSYGVGFNGPEGNLPGQLGDDQSDATRSITWRETVELPRGNARERSIIVNVGLKSYCGDSRFGTTLYPLKLSTTRIADASIKTFTVSEDPANKVGKRYININAEIVNPEGYYTIIIRNSEKKEIGRSSGGATTLSCSEEITREMFQTKRNYYIEIKGKDSTVYITDTKPITVSPSGAGVYGYEDNNILDIQQTTFRNVNNKEATEVWVVVDGQIRKTNK